jgi:hypothetical protein
MAILTKNDQFKINTNFKKKVSLESAEAKSQNKTQ